MKRVIDGRVYNTETATEICELPCRHNPGDFGYHQTSLYLTKNGRYFLAGGGGPMSMWARALDGNSTGGGSGVRPLDKSEARDYAESADLDDEELRSAGFEIEEA